MFSRDGASAHIKVGQPQQFSANTTYSLSNSSSSIVLTPFHKYSIPKILHYFLYSLAFHIPFLIQPMSYFNFGLRGILTSGFSRLLAFIRSCSNHSWYCRCSCLSFMFYTCWAVGSVHGATSCTVDYITGFYPLRIGYRLRFNLNDVRQRVSMDCMVAKNERF